MDFAPSGQAQLLHETARHFLRQEWSLPKDLDPDQQAGEARRLWRAVAKLGWQRLGVDESAGGLGGAIEDRLALVHEVGYALAPIPLTTQTLVVGHLLASSGRSDELDALLEGEAFVATNLPAFYEDAARGIELNGALQFPYVSEVRKGGHLLLSLARPAPHLVLRSLAGDSDNIRYTTDSMASDLAEMTIAKDRLSEAVSLPIDEQVLGHALGLGLLGSSTEMVGSMERVLDLTVTYAKDRVQFGRSIGSFQAIQHRCAEMAILYDTARLMALQGIEARRAGDFIGLRSQKAWVSEAYRAQVRHAQQVHAGAGFIEEHELPKRFRHMKVRTVEYGSASTHREAIREPSLLRARLRELALHG